MNIPITMNTRKPPTTAIMYLLKKIPQIEIATPAAKQCKESLTAGMHIWTERVIYFNFKCCYPDLFTVVLM